MNDLENDDDYSAESSEDEENFEDGNNRIENQNKSEIELEAVNGGMDRLMKEYANFNEQFN